MREVLARLPVRSVKPGTGENGIPPVQGDAGLPARRAIKLTLTSNGHSVAVLDDESLRAFSDVAFSLDRPTRDGQDARRGADDPGMTQQQAERCRRLGVGVTIIAVMMRVSHDGRRFSLASTGPAVARRSTCC